MNVTETDSINFWKFMKRVDNYQVSLPNHHLFYITFDSQSGKIQFVNDVTTQKGELTKADFKLLFGKHEEYIRSYLKNNEKLPRDHPNEFYVANIILDYFKWIA